MKATIQLLGCIGLVSTTLSGLAQDTAAGPAAAPAPAPAAPAATAPAPGQRGEVIDVIEYRDASLSSVIENLARQAGINYMIDPKVGYGQVGPDGKPAPQPIISIRWEKVTAEQALHAVLNNYNLQMVDDPKTKIARVTVKDPAAPDPLLSKTVQLKYASPSNILAAVQTTLTDKRSKVVPDVRTSQLVILATEKELIAVDELVAKLDAPTKQVLIEAKLLETSKNPRTIKGIDWSDTLTAQRITMGNNALPGTSPTPPITYTDPVTGAPNTIPGDPGSIGGILSDPKLLMSTAGKFFQPQTAFLNADGMSVVMSFINKDADAQVLSTPRAVTLDNQEAVLSVTRAHPIFRNTAGTQGSPGGSEVTYTNLGTILRVTPRISANDFINLTVRPEVSSLAGTVKKTVASTVNEADVYDVRSITTEVMIPSGNTLVLGGLVSDDRNSGYSKVPIFGDLPVVGQAFRHSSKTQLKKNLIIFITPTIVQDSDFQPTQTAFLRSKAEEPEDPEPTAWDSAKPLDWSKPSLDKYYKGHRDPTR